MSKKTRWWFITVWDVDYDYNPLIEWGQIRYVKRGHIEYAPDTGRPHRHILAYSVNSYSKTKKSFGTIAKMFKFDIHPDVVDAKGSELEIDAYKDKETGKPGDEFGDRPKQGMRTDIDDMVKQINEGLKVDDIAMEYPSLYHQYGRTFNKIEEICLRKKFRTEMTEGLWLWGDTGVGKSHKAFTGYTPETHYLYPNDGGWWDGYMGQETVIINEFRGGDLI